MQQLPLPNCPFCLLAALLLQLHSSMLSLPRARLAGRPFVILHHFIHTNPEAISFNGFDVLPTCISWSAAHIGAEEGIKYLKTYENRLLTLMTTEPIQYLSLDEYDMDTMQLKEKR